MMARTLAVALILASLGPWLVGTRCAQQAGLAGATVPTVSATVLARYPHDPRAYTQGLVVESGILYEGTGWYGESSLRRVDLTSGSVLQQVPLPPDVFGEGIAVVRDRIVQLTWRSQLGYVYDRASFTLLHTFGYQTEGWGLTYDGTHLIMSDGTSTLRFLDPESLSEVRRVHVQAAGRPVERLNELEYIDGDVFANVYLSDQVAVIDPSTGDVRYWVDLSGLNPLQQATGDEVLNGIAYDAQRRQLMVTGKRWPVLYEISLDSQGS
jgi:glutamine cyclotransferase